MLATTNVPVWASGADIIEDVNPQVNVESANIDSIDGTNSNELLGDPATSKYNSSLSVGLTDWDETPVVSGDILENDGDLTTPINYYWSANNREISGSRAEDIAVDPSEVVAAAINDDMAGRQSDAFTIPKEKCGHSLVLVVEIQGESGGIAKTITVDAGPVQKKDVEANGLTVEVKADKTPQYCGAVPTIDYFTPRDPKRNFVPLH